MAKIIVRHPRARNFVHGHTAGHHFTKTYSTWADMVKRCTNPKAIGWPHYGGRGIQVCSHWLTFTNFLADMGEKPEGRYELDRYPNKDGNYEPGNCRWATRSQNMRNTNRNHLVTFNGKTQCLAAWSEELGIKYNKLKDRLKKLHWTAERAFTTP
jgi:hypothetical protein